MSLLCLAAQRKGMVIIMLQTSTRANPRTLTDDHREFAAKNHDEVIYGFLGSRKLSRNSYYDVVILKYLYAVQIYLDRPELQKYSFKTIAYRQMTSAINSHWKKVCRPKRNAYVISLNSLYDGGIEEQMGVVSAAPPIHEHVEAADDWRRIMPLLTQKELEALTKKVAGYTYREIASEVGITYAGINSRFYRMRQKARACMAV